MFKLYEFPSEKNKNLNRSEKDDLVMKIEIAKIINQIDKKLLRVVIPKIPLADKSSRIQNLDKVSEISFNGEDKNKKRIKATKTIVNWRAHQKTPFRPNFPNQTFIEQPIVIQNPYNANNIYEWNIEDKLEYEIINILQFEQMTMISIVYQTNHRYDDATIIHVLIVEFIT